MNGYIYAIEADNGLVKIGFTKELRSRLSHLRANNCMKLTPLGYARGTQVQESDLHRLLSAEHVKGEWFRRGRLVGHFLSKLADWPVSIEKFRLQRAETSADEIISRFGGRYALAELLNCRYEAISKWHRNGGVPGKFHVRLLRLAEELGISLEPHELLREQRRPSASSEAA